MGNTVGSLIKSNRYWQKGWIEIKQSLFITNQQKSLIIGTILGDGTLRVGAGAINANLKIEQGLAQQEYVWWKYNILQPFVFTGPKISHRYRENGEKYEKSLWFRTVRHPLITNFHKRFYKDGKKIVPNNISSDLNALALAVWIMDDGSLNKNKIDISTYSFTKREINVLQKAIYENFSLESNYYQDRDKGCRMYFRASETKRLIEIIKPFIIESLRYKITLK